MEKLNKSIDKIKIYFHHPEWKTPSVIVAICLLIVTIIGVVATIIMCKNSTQPIPYSSNTTSPVVIETTTYTIKPTLTSTMTTSTISTSTTQETTISTTSLDDNAIWKLPISNQMITDVYDKAYVLATFEIHDAQLSALLIDYCPYQNKEVNVTFWFYSKWADRKLQIHSDDFINVQLGNNVAAKYDDERVVFTSIPWVKAPDWQLMVRKMFEKIGPLTENPYTYLEMCILSNWENEWDTSIWDNENTKLYDFIWDGQSDPVLDRTLSGVLHEPA
jgi:hypothetical protein